MDSEPTAASLTAFVLGILSLIFWVVPLFGIPLAIIGITFGLRRDHHAAIILNIIGLSLSVAVTAALAVGLGLHYFCLLD